MTNINEELRIDNSKKYKLNFNVFCRGNFFLKLLSLMKILLFRCFISCKWQWKKLINNALSSYGKKHAILMFCIGFCNFIATTPFSIIIILPLTFGSFFYIFEERIVENLKSQLLTIFSFLFGYFTSIFWWFFVPLTTDFIHLFWLTPFAIFGLPFVMACVFIPFFALFILIWKCFFLKKKEVILSNIGEVFLFLGFLLCWFLGEYVRGHYIFGGFPWMLFGHFVPYSFAMQSVKFFGIDVYSITFLALILAVYLLIFKRYNFYIKYISLIIIAYWILNCLIGGAILCLHSNEEFNKKFDINIIASQANNKATLYIDDNLAKEILNKNIKILSILSKSSRPTLMLMPEGSVNFNIDSGDTLTKYLGRIVPNDNSLLLTSGIDMHGVSPYNVIYAINDGGYILDTYKKQKLVPFGEYIPFRKFFPRLTKTITGVSFDFASDGDNDLFIFYRNLPIIYPIICYESIFPDYVKNNIKLSRKKLSNDLTKEYTKQIGTKTLAERGEIVVNLTNDAWLKWSVAPYQHFLMARFLAVATGLPVVRVSNNGISAFIDHYGRIIAKTSLNHEDLLLIGRIR